MPKCILYVRFTHYDKHLFNHFMKHYLNLGVYKICININYRFEEDKTDYENFVEFVNSSEYINNLVITLGPNNDTVAEGVHCTIAKKSALALCDLNEDFVIPADSDEFHKYPDTLENLMIMMVKNNIDYLTGHTYEKVSQDGFCKNVDSNIDIFEQFPNVNNKLFVASKIGLIKSNIADLLGVGHHYLNNKKLTCKNGVQTHHFRWTLESKKRVENWIKLWKNPLCQGWKDISKYEKILELYNCNLLEYK